MDDRNALTDQLITKLFEQELHLDGNINDMSLLELLNQLSRKCGVMFTIDEDSFKAEMMPDIKEKKPRVAAISLRGLTLHHLLVRVLSSMGATYLVHSNVLEITTAVYAAKRFDATLVEDDRGRKSLTNPLVSAFIEKKPLADVVEILSNRYDLNITFGREMGVLAKSLVSARLLKWDPLESTCRHASLSIL